MGDAENYELMKWDLWKWLPILLPTASTLLNFVLKLLGAPNNFTYFTQAIRRPKMK